ncbi:MAG: HU family DNA-binding protein [Tannerellaceae bacterium]|jgi:nucleoid DNA-binding protein/nucleoid-associated protein YgaU|nr:HU family DNA-binding protein [Tannerellaceae bacterium]
MNNRLTIQEIADALAESTGKSRESIDMFLEEFISLVRDRIFVADRYVQIKGIGNFRIIQVEKRESIDVNTKERIVIPEHYKLSFTPDKEMKEIVNKPFAFFESIEIGEETDVPMEIPDEKEKEEDVEEDFSVDEKDVPEEGPPAISPPPPPLPPPVPEPLPQVSIETIIQQWQEEKEEEKEEEEKFEEEEALPFPTKLPVKEEEEREQEEEEQPEQEEVLPPLPFFPEEKETNVSEPLVVEYKSFSIEKETTLKNKKMADYNENRTNRPSYDGDRTGSNNNNTLVILLLVAVVVLIISLVSVLLLKKDVLFPGTDTAGSTRTGNEFTLPPAETDINDEWGIEDESIIEEDPIVETTPPATTFQPSRQTAATTVRVQRGDRLNLFALKYYGNKVFWVYIYQHNRSKLSNPDIIPVGIDLVIPAAGDYQINANNPASVKKAFILQGELLSAYRRGQLSSSGSSNSYPSYQGSYGNQPYLSYPQNNSYGTGTGTGQYSPYGGNTNSQYGTGQQQQQQYPYGGNAYDNTNSQYGTGQYGGNDPYDNSNITPYDGGNQYNNNQSNQYNNSLYNDF